MRFRAAEAQEGQEANRQPAVVEIAALRSGAFYMIP